MFTPPFKSDVAYSVQNEDYRSELAVIDRLEKRDELRILMIASAGENALSLLTRPEVAQIVAVDLNPAQIHLCELRRAAILALSRDEQLRFFGVHPEYARAGDEMARISLYTRVRDELPPDSLSFWDERRDRDIPFGVHHVGRNDAIMHEIQGRLREAGLLPVRRPMPAEDLAKWQEVYETLFTPGYVMGAFGIPSEALAMKIVNMAGFLAASHFRALREDEGGENYFVTTCLYNRYAHEAGEAGYPLYLQQEGQEALRKAGALDLLHLAAGNMVEQMGVLAENFGGFDLISISNIADWMSEEQFGNVVKLAKKCLTPGGAFLARMAAESEFLREKIGQEMGIDAGLNEALPKIERGPWFRTVAAGFNQ